MATRDLVVITERVDDVALLMGQMVKLGFVEILDWHLRRHWEATAAELGLDGGDLAGVYPHGRRSSESIGRSVHQRDATHLSGLSGQVIDRWISMMIA